MEESTETDWSAVYAEIEDALIPSLELSAFDRSLYYHLLRHTRLIRNQSSVFAIGPLAKATGISDIKVREVIRNLHQKGCLRIDQRSRLGHHISVLLPSEIPGLRRPSVSPALDVLSIDFFSGRRYVDALLSRQDGCCFYCLKKLSEDVCELDHIRPQKDVSDNSYKNIVAACHNCNKSKGDMLAEDFVRSLYRSGVINESELHGRLVAIQAVCSGQAIPAIAIAGGS